MRPPRYTVAGALSRSCGARRGTRTQRASLPCVDAQKTTTDTSRDGLARGRGGRQPGGVPHSCPAPVAAARDRPARRDARTGRSDLLSRPPGRGRAGRVRGRPADLHGPHGTGQGRHAHHPGHRAQHRCRDDHRCTCRSAGRARTRGPHVHRRGGGAHRLPGRCRPGRDRPGLRGEDRLPAVQDQPGVHAHHPGEQAGAGQGRRLPARRLPVRGDREPAVRAGHGHQADLLALAARGRRQTLPAHLRLAADLHHPRDGGVRLRRAPDPRLPRRLPRR